MNIKYRREEKSLEVVTFYLKSFNVSFAQPTECERLVKNMTRQVLHLISKLFTVLRD